MEVSAGNNSLDFQMRYHIVDIRHRHHIDDESLQPMYTSFLTYYNYHWLGSYQFDSKALYIPLSATIEDSYIETILTLYQEKTVQVFEQHSHVNTY